MNSLKEVQNHLEKYEISEESFLDMMKNLTYYHAKNCASYNSILQKVYNFKNERLFPIKHIDDIPFFPVNLFKTKILKSIKEENVYKIMESSGTSGQLTSKIILDKFNARSQALALSKIFTDFTGLKRPNILIIDNPNLIKNQQHFSARLAGIVGFRSLCRKSYFALNEDMSINLEEIKNCLINSDGKVLLYGFTYIIWLYFALKKLPSELRLLFKEKAVLLHGGGWKKLDKVKVNKNKFKEKLFNNTGIKKVINYYGMVEQTGSIFMECEMGYLHANPLCDVIPRSINNINQVSRENHGLAQVLSTLPTSYPGHSLLTEDLIKVNSSKQCACGRIGTTFEVIGRIKRAEERGCSDTYES